MGDDVEAYSAGTRPQGLNPIAVRVMRECGVEIGGQRSKNISDVPAEMDLVVTVCDRAHSHCPVFSGSARVVHHTFDDPPQLAAGAASEDEAVGHYRRVRDEIRGFVAGLPALLSMHERANHVELKQS